MSKRPTRRSAPQPGRSLVDGVFRRVGLDKEARAYRAMAAWHVAAGPRLSGHVRAEAVRGSALVLRVASSAWANELSFLRAALLEQLRKTRGGEWIAELRFSIGPLEGLPSWEDAPRAPSPPPPPPPRVDDAQIAKALLEMTDPGLRAAFAELYAHARSRR